MNVILMMFDSLNRRFLEPYGCTETITPNFSRLAEHTVRFNNCYAGSLPCIPARRELHTGRYNFLHRSWGPLEPFDDSMPRTLNEHGIYSHLVTDHGHYWEEGGATYHSQYTTWEIIRGQEGDKWNAVVGGVEDTTPNFHSFEGLREGLYRQNLSNRAAICEEKDFPLVKTFDKGLEFLQDNYQKGPFFLQIESFSPHEPFMASEQYKALYRNAERTKKYEWPDYAPVEEGQEEIDQIREAYFASLSMCDAQLGRLLDFMDETDAWKDTMLIVNTDHGYMLSEHGYWAKNYMPCFDEIVHTPLFVWDPRTPEYKAISRDALVQTLDVPATILSFFGIEPFGGMQGRTLDPVIARDDMIHDSALFGSFGGHVCMTDGHTVYMRAPRNMDVPLYEYTLLPTHMMSFFSLEELRTARMHDAFEFTKGVPVMQIETERAVRCCVKEDLLFNLDKDPNENCNLAGTVDTAVYEKKLRQIMTECDAPEELYRRFLL